MQAWEINLVGFREVQRAVRDIQDQVAGATDTWVIGPNTDYDVYVELGTAKMPARPYVGPGAKRGAERIKEAEALAQNPNDLLRILALYIEAEIKKVIHEKVIIDTSTLLRSVEAVKQ